MFSQHPCAGVECCERQRKLRPCFCYTSDWFPGLSITALDMSSAKQSNLRGISEKFLLPMYVPSSPQQFGKFSRMFLIFICWTYSLMSCNFDLKRILLE